MMAFQRCHNSTPWQKRSKTTSSSFVEFDQISGPYLWVYTSAFIYSVFTPKMTHSFICSHLLFYRGLEFLVYYRSNLNYQIPDCSCFWANKTGLGTVSLHPSIHQAPDVEVHLLCRVRCRLTSKPLLLSYVPKKTYHRSNWSLYW